MDSTKTNQINALWMSGKSIKEINDRFNLINILPKHLEAVTKNSVLDFTSRWPDYKKVTVSRLALSGFYIMKDGKETSHALKYSTFKTLKI